jgi:hypothetical protein
MKLVDPNDDALNAAFAEKVAGWQHTMLMSDPLGLFTSPNGKHWQAFCLPFTTSADAVLPWVKPEMTLVIYGPDGRNKNWYVEYRLRDFTAEADTFPRACVIALLRAHGVTIEFTK